MIRQISVVFMIILSAVSQGKLRDENITDQEVREIQSLVQSFTYGEINYIGGVLDSCHCTEGPECTATLDIAVVSDLGTKQYELSLQSKKWELGKTQRWLLEYEKLMSMLMAEPGEIKDEDILNKLYVHGAEYPECVKHS